VKQKFSTSTDALSVVDHNLRVDHYQWILCYCASCYYCSDDCSVSLDFIIGYHRCDFYLNCLNHLCFAIRHLSHLHPVGKDLGPSSILQCCSPFH